MSDYLKDKNIRLRCKKQYPGAHTHIIIGRVEEENARYIAVKGRTFHFGRIVDGMRSQVHAGKTMIRIIPWDNIEIIHWLSGKTDWEADFRFDQSGNLVLCDKAETIIAERRDGME
ncbi:MAG: hypothetical protein MR727_05830 [Lentisphaeria bacterium]|nr:hypothetical protein [Lentisphaeria bacterium]